MRTAVFSESRTAPPVLRRPTTLSRRSDLWGNLCACLIPMLMFLEVQLVGRLFLSELVLIGLLPFLLIKRARLLLSPIPKTFLLLGFMWLLAQILTDVVRETPFEDWIRGWSKIIFTLLDFSAIYLFLNGKEKRFFYFSAGIAFGQLLYYFLVLHGNGDWKFGYGSAVTLLAVLASQLGFFGRRKILSVALILSMGVLNIFMDYRSMGIFCLLTGVFVLAKQSNRKLNWKSVVILLMVGGVALTAITNLYEYGASEGLLGERARDKYLMQTHGDLGVLLGGRSEFLGSFSAVADSPLIGHGSWAKDPKYVQIMLESMIEHGYKVNKKEASDLIPSHSFIMGAWVEAGLLGAIFWGWVFVLTIRALFAAYVVRTAITPLIVFIAIDFLWSIPFSPFGGGTRLVVAYYVALMMFVLITLQKSKIMSNKAFR